MSRSNFPNEVDQFTELWDLPNEKYAEARRLTELKGKAVLSNDEQNEIKSLTSSLREYMITPETWNKFQDALQAVQQFFYDNVQGFLEDKQEIWDSYIREFKYVGKWKTGVKYNFQNMVTNDKGDLFISKEEHTSSASNNPNTSDRYWQRASSKGDKGDIGLNAIYKGDWDNGTSYKMGDAVCFGRVDWHGGVTYIAKRDNTGKSPDKSPDDWFLYQQLYVGQERPVGAMAGLHFIQEV